MGNGVNAAMGFIGALVLTLVCPLSQQEVFASAPAKAEPRPTEGSIATTLLRVHWRSFDLVLHGFFDPGSGTSIAIRGDRALIAKRTGRFFEARFRESEVEIRRTPLELETNYRDIRQYSEELNEGVHDTTHRDRFVGVTGLLFLSDGETLAAAYTHWNREERCVTSRVAVTRVQEDWRESTDDWRTVFISSPCLPVSGKTMFFGQFSGGRLAEVRPGFLYLTLGDFAHDGVQIPQIFAQDEAVSYGKIIEIDIESGEHRIVSIGHRNPQGLLVDSQGQVWSTEHGPKGGDKLNLIRDGQNYGWPRVTLGANYGDYIWPLSDKQGRHDGYEQPVFAWLPSAAVNNLIEVRNFTPEWEGDLLVAFLAGHRLGRLRLEGERVVYEEPVQIGERVRDIAQLGDGRIVLWTDSGKLVLLSPDTTESMVTRMFVSMPEDMRSVIQECAKCHVLDGPSGGGRISLWGIHGRKIGGGDRALLSKALADRRGEWNDETLDAYLENPGRMVPGTTMQYSGIENAELRRAVIQFLKELY